MSTARLKADVSELTQINAELKRLQDLMKPLRQRKKVLEENITKFMKQTGEKGLTSIKMSNVQVETVEKKLRERIKKEDKETMAVQFLQQAGINNARRTFAALQELLKGEEQTVHQVKLKDPYTGKKK